MDSKVVHPITVKPMQNVDTNILAEEIQKQNVWVEAVREEMGRVVVGQHDLIERLLIGLLTNGHVLLEGVPVRSRRSFSGFSSLPIFCRLILSEL